MLRSAACCRRAAANLPAARSFPVVLLAPSVRGVAFLFPATQHESTFNHSPTRVSQPLRAFAVQTRQPSRQGGSKGPNDRNKSGGNKGGSGRPTQSAADDREPPMPVANKELGRKYREVRVIDENGVNLGVVSPAEGLKAAQAKGLDLILFSPAAVPPVCRIASLPAFMRQQRELHAEKRRQERASKQKEIRCTSRTDDHDLNTKTARIVEFLKEGRPVRVVVSLTLSAWTQEEPARREVYARILRRVAEAGVGFCPVDSIRGEGPSLSGMFQPTATPKAQVEHDKALAKLATPLMRHPPKALDTPEHVEATVAAAAAGVLPAARIGAAVAPSHGSPVAGTAPAGVQAAGPSVILPPPEVLRAIRSPKSNRPDRSSGDDEDAVSATREPNPERDDFAADLQVRGRNRGKAARMLK